MQLEDLSESTAAENFRCEALSCRMSGMACAKMHVLARTTRDISRHTCIRCPLGARRATLLKIGEPTCQAVDGDRACGQPAQPGSKFCTHHAHRAVAPKVRLAISEARFSAVEVDWSANILPPSAPLQEGQEDERPRIRQVQPKLQLKPEMHDAGWAVSCRCGVRFRPHADRRFPMLPICSDCAGKAVRRCRKLGLELTPGNVEAHLEVQRVQVEKVSCGRCSGETKKGTNICPTCVTNVIAVFARRFARTVTREEAQTVYLELPRKRQYSSRKGTAQLN